MQSRASALNFWPRRELHKTKQTKVDKSDCEHCRNTSTTIQIEFYFIGEKSEREQVWELLLEFIFDTTLCGKPLDANQIDFDPQPGTVD